jgi:hypothetical protein
MSITASVRFFNEALRYARHGGGVTRATAFILRHLLGLKNPLTRGRRYSFSFLFVVVENCGSGCGLVPVYAPLLKYLTKIIIFLQKDLTPRGKNVKFKID